MHTEQRHARGGEFERQRQPVERTADVGHGLLLLRREAKARQAAGHPVDEQTHGAAGHQALGIGIVGQRRQRQRRQPKDLLAGNAQWLLAGDDDVQRRRLRQQACHQRRQRRQHVFGVVQNEQQRQRLQRTRQPNRTGLAGRAGIEVQALRECRTQGRGGRGLGRERGEFDEPHAVGPGPPLRCGERLRQPRLADARRAGERDQTLAAEQGSECGELGIATDQRRQGRSQVAGGGRTRCSRRGQHRCGERRRLGHGRCARRQFYEAGEAVTTPRHGLDPEGLFRVIAERAAQFTDYRLDHAFGDEAPAPDRVEQLVLGHQLARAPRQRHQQLEGLGPQRDQLPAPAELRLGHVEREGAELQGRRTWACHGDDGKGPFADKLCIRPPQRARNWRARCASYSRTDPYRW